jgi:hypothetical protein
MFFVLLAVEEVVAETITDLAPRQVAETLTVLEAPLP